MTVTIQGRIKGDQHKLVCPNDECGKVLDGFSSVSADVAPNVGDVTVCVYCASVLEYVRLSEEAGGGIGLQMASSDTLAECDLVAIGRAQAICRGVREKLNG